MPPLASVLILLSIAGPAGAQAPGWNESRIRAILAPPTRSEIKSVRKSWPDDPPPVVDAQVVEHGKLARDGMSFEVVVYRHRIDDRDHYTAIFVPEGAPDRSLPVLVETPGVRFDYPTRRIVDGPFVMSILGELSGNFVIVEPCLRGHELQAIDIVHRAEGDRRDSWDGAADDVAAAVSLAVAEIPAADGRVVSFGLSRGGGVALLHGVRDRRVVAVVAMSAPTDWFALMARADSEWAARIHEAAAGYDGPADDRTVQFYEWFLQDRAALPDQEIRRRLIASSALYFTEWLPPTLVHHGALDTSVPSVNAAAVHDRFVALDRPSDTHQVMLHEGANHLLEASPAAVQTRAFLRRIVGVGIGNESTRGTASLGDDSAERAAADPQRAIDLGNAAYVDGYARADAPAIALLYDQNGVRLGPGGVVVRGRNAIEEGIRQFLAEVGAVKVVVKTVDLWVIDELAYETGIWSYTFTRTGQSEAQTIGGRYVTIWKKQKDGAWRIAADMGVPGTADAIAPAAED